METHWPEFDLGFPEDVLFEVLHRKQEPRGWYVVEALVLEHGSNIHGGATYERDYGGLLNYVIKDLIKGILDEGFWVAEGVSVDCRKGYRWLTDDQLIFNYQSLRQATDDERHLLR